MCKLHSISSQVPFSASMAPRHNYQLVVLFQSLQTDQCDYWLCCKLSRVCSMKLKVRVAWAHYEDAWRGKAWWHQVHRSYGENTRPMAASSTELSGGSPLTVLSHRVVPMQGLRKPGCMAQNRAGMGRGCRVGTNNGNPGSSAWASFGPLLLTVYMHLDVPKLNWFQKEIFIFKRYSYILGVMMDRTRAYCLLSTYFFAM